MLNSCIQMVGEEGERPESFFFFPLLFQCSQYVWIRIELQDSEIAPFYCTSVYFESVFLAFLHLTWWLHHFPQGTEYVSEPETLNRISLCTQAATGKGGSTVYHRLVVLSGLDISQGYSKNIHLRGEQSKILHTFSTANLTCIGNLVYNYKYKEYVPSNIYRRYR